MIVRKILVVLPSLNVGGAERVTVTVINKLVKLGFHISLAVCDSSGPLKNNIDKNIELINLRHRKMSLSIPSLISILKVKKFDVVMSVLPNSAFACFIASLFTGMKFKSISVIHSSVYQRYTMDLKNNFVKTFLTRVALWFAYRLHDEIIAVSSGVKDDFCKCYHYPENKVSVIYNPIIDSLSWVELRRINRAQPIKLLSVGRLIKTKKIDTMMMAMRELNAKGVDFVLDIIGDGPEFYNLKKLSDEFKLSDKVNFHGLINHDAIAGFYKKADIFLMTSETEGLPTVLVESLSNGCNVISSNCKSGPSEILSNGEFGYLFETNNVSDFVSKIILMINGFFKCESHNLNNQLNKFESLYVAKQYIKIFSK